MIVIWNCKTHEYEIYKLTKVEFLKKMVNEKRINDYSYDVLTKDITKYKYFTEEIRTLVERKLYINSYLIGKGDLDEPITDEEYESMIFHHMQLIDNINTIENTTECLT